MNQLAPWVRRQLRAGGDQPPLVPLDHLTQRVDDDQETHVRVLQHRPRGVAEPEPTHHHVRRRGRQLRESEARQLHLRDGEQARHQELVVQLNLGLQDAVNLGWKLAAEIHGSAPAGLLDTYEVERRPASERVIMHTQAQSALIAPGKEVTELRVLFTELLRDKAVVQHIADLMSGADIRYDMGVPSAGHWAPDLVLHTETDPPGSPS